MSDVDEPVTGPTDDTWREFEEEARRCAFISRLGANAATLRCWPEESTAAVARIARDSGFDVGDPGEHPSWALYFETEDFDDDRLGELADALRERGIDAFAHVLAHGDVLGEHVDVFRRVGSRDDDERSGVVMARLLMGPRTETGHREVDGWFLGSAPDLAAVERSLARRFEVERAESADGLDALRLTTVVLEDGASTEAGPLGGDAELTLDNLVDDLLEAFDDQRIEAPFEVIDAFDDEDDD